ncbi:MAG: signal peptidase II [Lachnospiraceae bacterium]|nr:signal peptidase II [Lachnospiraceae bacterium]
MKTTEAYLLAGLVALTDTAVKGFIKDPPVKNYGFAGNRMDRFPKAVAGVSAVLTGVLAVSMAFAPGKMRLPLALVLGGALSNSADRMIRGYVVDYIPVSRKYYGNISDLAILAGSGIGAVTYMLDGEEPEPDKG